LVVGDDRDTVVVFFLVVFGFVVAALVVVVADFVAVVIFTGEDGAATPWLTEDAEVGTSEGDDAAVLCVTGGGSGPIGTWAPVCAGPVTVWTIWPAGVGGPVPSIMLAA